MRIYAIYYQKNPDFMKRDSYEVGKIDISHEYLGFMPAEGLEELYMKMQGDGWSPEGEARGLIEHLGLCYTSMSIGDVVFDCEDRCWYQCMMHGWEKLEEVA
jgi:hypothetical protein